MILIPNFHSSIQELPDKDGSVSIHGKNKQVSQTKMFTIKDGFSSGIASEIFVRETVPHYSLKQRNDLRIPLAIHTMYHSDKSISFLASSFFSMAINIQQQLHYNHQGPKNSNSAWG